MTKLLHDMNRGEPHQRLIPSDFEDPVFAELAQALHEALLPREGSFLFEREPFIAISHDLRASLNTLLLLARVLVEEDPESPLSYKQKRAATMLLDAGEEMLEVVNELRHHANENY